MQPPMRAGNSNDFQTPAYALKPLYPFLPKEWIVWECAAGRGNIVKALESRGHNVIASDVLTGQDFLHWQPEQQWDCIVTNPPYSIKQEFLERCYSLGKPFALLLPLTTFETVKRQALFRRYGLEVIFFPNRINFETPSGQGESSWFATAWFTNGLHIGKEMSFVLPEEQDSMQLSLL